MNPNITVFINQSPRLMDGAVRIRQEVVTAAVRPMRFALNSNLYIYIVFFFFLLSVSDPAKGRGRCDRPRLQPRLRFHHQSHLWRERGE